MKRRGRAQEGLRKKRATKCAAGDVSLPAGIARLYTSSLGVGRAQPGKAGVTSWPSTGTKKYFHPQPTRSCPPDPPKACCQTLVVGMWKCSPPQSQHFNSVFFPLEREEGRMRRVPIEQSGAKLFLNNQEETKGRGWEQGCDDSGLGHAPITNHLPSEV